MAKEKNVAEEPQQSKENSGTPVPPEQLPEESVCQDPNVKDGPDLTKETPEIIGQGLNEVMSVQAENLAQAFYSARRALVQGIGDWSLEPWDKIDQDRKGMFCEMVQKAINSKGTTSNYIDDPVDGKGSIAAIALFDAIIADHLSDENFTEEVFEAPENFDWYYADRVYQHFLGNYSEMDLNKAKEIMTSTQRKSIVALSIFNIIKKLTSNES